MTAVACFHAARRLLRERVGELQSAANITQPYGFEVEGIKILLAATWAAEKAKGGK